MKIDLNAQNVLKILDDASARWWIDNGTFLGFVRDKSIIEGDNDFDLSILVESEQEVQKVIDAFINQGMAIKTYWYKNQVVKVKIFSKYMVVDIQVFRQKSNQLISFFAYYGAKPNTNRNSLINLFYRVNARIFLRKVETGMHAKGIINMSLLKLLFCARIGSWVYEADDILPLRRSGSFNLPHLAQKYLTFRYGLWRYPNKNWDSYTMDGARKY